MAAMKMCSLTTCDQTVSGQEEMFHSRLKTKTYQKEKGVFESVAPADSPSMAGKTYVSDLPLLSGNVARM